MSPRVAEKVFEVRSGVVSVVLVNYRGADDTITCLRAFDDVNWTRERLELMVVEHDQGDNGVESARQGMPSPPVVEAGADA